MSIPTDQVQAAITAARVREAGGYFARVHAGDQRAASLFARLVATDCNPAGSLAGYGWLSKAPGETQVDGYAEDAIVWTADPANLSNVLDLVNGAGAPGASIGGAVKERRPANLWVQPVPLTDEELAYLRGGAVAVPPPIVDCAAKFPPQDQVYAFGLALNTKYQTDRHAPLIGIDSDQIPLYVNLKGMSIWLGDYMRERVAGRSHAEAQAIVFATIDAVP